MWCGQQDGDLPHLTMREPHVGLVIVHHPRRCLRPKSRVSLGPILTQSRQVGPVGRQSSRHLGGVAEVAMTRNHEPRLLPKASQHLQAVPIVLDRVGRPLIEQRDFDVGQHVPGQEYSVDQQREMSWRVCLVSC